MSGPGRLFSFFLQYLAKKFNDTHENIEMEFLIVPNEEARERFLAMVSGDNAPQLVGPGHCACAMTV